MKKYILLTSIVICGFSCDDEELEGVFLTDATACGIATDDALTAKTFFDLANNDNYTEVCVNYKEALVQQALLCGDAEGGIQTIITNLGDCNNLCQEAKDARTIAQNSFETTSITDYESHCNTYKQSLEAAITQCGDDYGVLQSLIDDLGSCELPESYISFSSGTLNRILEQNVSVTLNGMILEVRAEDDLSTDWVYFEVTQDEVGVDIITNFTANILGNNYVPIPGSSDNFTSEITVNDSMMMRIEGTFNGPVESTVDDTALPLNDGVILINY